MAGKRLAVCDPSGRLLAELAPVARDADLTLHALKAGQYLDGVSAFLIAPLVAVDLGPAPENGPPRWVVGNIENAARLAGAATQAGAAGVLLTPVAASTLTAIAGDGSGDAGEDLTRARKLIASSLVELTGAAAETLAAIADGFGAQDCIVWWRDASHQMTPTSAREPPDPDYRVLIANAARMAAAAQGTVILPGAARSVIADTLRSGPTEVAGMVALVADSCRPFSPAERNDMRAIAARLTRELGWLQSHRRLVAEGERLLAGSLHDPLTGAMTRGAFEQTVAHEVTGATRRKERLTLAVIDIVGLRRINLQYGHRAGDEVIAQTASRVRAVVRGNDPIGRLGADEIAVLLVGADADQAVQVVRKLIYKIQSEPIQADEALLAVSVRAVASEIGPRERSGEAALGRCYGALRTAPHGDVTVVGVDSRLGDDPGAYVGALSAGTVVGGTYRVVHELSRGAMGVVYRGEDLGLGRAVAIKVLRSDLASDRELVGKFRAEAGILASLHHPNLVQVYALGEHAGEVYFVMELVEGEPLSEVLRATFERKEWLHPAAVAHIALEIGDALDAMHARGVIHRDVKPANILLDRVRDRAVLVDVGVAVKGVGERRDAAGTPGFAAPESFMGLAETPATDVYGLGATVYCMLAGRAPFGSGAAQHVLRRQMQEEMPKLAPVREHLSSAVDTVLSKALAPDPNKRWASASTFAFALGRALQRMPTRERMAVRLPTDPVFEELILPAAEIEPVESKPKSGAREVLGQVRAAHLRVLSRIVQAQVGDSGLARLVADAPQLAYVFASTLAPLEWVALGDLVGALERARQWVPGQHVPRKVGRGTMTATFARIFGADPGSLTPETVLGALPTFWPRYHDWGSIAASVQSGTAGISLEGFSGSTDVCALVGAQLERIVELTGATSVTAAHHACTFVGASRCEYRLTWTPVPERA